MIEVNCLRRSQNINISVEVNSCTAMVCLMQLLDRSPLSNGLVAWGCRIPILFKGHEVGSSQFPWLVKIPILLGITIVPNKAVIFLWKLVWHSLCSGTFSCQVDIQLDFISEWCQEHWNVWPTDLLRYFFLLCLLLCE